MRISLGDGDGAQPLVIVNLHAEHVDRTVLAVDAIVGLDQVLLDARMSR